MLQRARGTSLVVLAVVAVLVVAGLAVLGPAGPASPEPASDGGVEPAADADAVAADPTADNTVTRIRVYPNGTARWTIRTRTRLDTDRRAAEYRAFQDRVRSNRSRYLDPFRRRISRVVENAGNATGRGMSAYRFRVSTSIQEVPRRWGVVTHEFLWKGFARSEGEALVVGDVFRGGFFLAANDTLELSIPSDYDATSIDPAPDGREGDTLTWGGREDFADGRPRVRLVPATTTTTTPGDGDRTTGGDGTDGTTAEQTTTGDDATGGDGGDGDGGGLDDAGSSSRFPMLLAGLGVTLMAVLGVAYAVRNGHLALLGSGEAVDEADGEDGSDEGSEADDREGTAVILTDEDRVEDLLEERGGQMKQADVADELDWSSSKTSRVLSGMADEDRIEKIRIGRENVIRFPEDDEDDGDPDREWG